eukprot:Gb_19025 [translate_table: standard]
MEIVLVFFLRFFVLGIWGFGVTAKPTLYGIHSAPNLHFSSLGKTTLDREFIVLIRRFVYVVGGRLPVTWYPQDFAAKIPMTNMNMRPDPATGYPGRTYRFYTGKTVYMFGDGLSYTNFRHVLVHAPKLISLPMDGKHRCTRRKVNSCEAVRVTHTKCQGLFLDVHVDVKNTGRRDGGHVLFLFSTPPSHHNSPQKQLLGFRKVHVPAGALERVHFTVDVCKDLSIVDKTGTRKLPVGSHLLHIGDLKHSVSLEIKS